MEDLLDEENASRVSTRCRAHRIHGRICVEDWRQSVAAVGSHWSFRRSVADPKRQRAGRVTGADAVWLQLSAATGAGAGCSAGYVLEYRRHSQGSYRVG